MNAWTIKECAKCAGSGWDYCFKCNDSASREALKIKRAEKRLFSTTANQLC